MKLHIGVLSRTQFSVGATIASTSTLPGWNKYISCSSRGESARGITLFAVTGNIVIDGRVCPESSIFCPADGTRIVLVGAFGLDKNR